MAALVRVAGVTKITLDGVAFRVQGGMEIDPSESEREPVIGVDGPHGFKEKPKAVSVKFDITVDKTVSVRGLMQVVNGTIVAEGPTGAVWLFANVFSDGKANYNPEDGKLSVMYYGSTAREIPASA